MNDRTIAVDLAKNVFEIGISERPGHVNETCRLSRGKFLNFFRESGTDQSRDGGLWVLALLGAGDREAGTRSEVDLTAVCDALRATEQERRDGREGVFEADRNTDILPVPLKTVEQQQLTGLHRMRSRWMETRTSRINMLRGLLREFGFVIPVGAHHLVPGVMALVEDANVEIPSVLREMFCQACEEIRELEAHIGSVEEELQALAKQTPDVELLQSIPGIGLLTATALVGFVGDIQRFPSLPPLCQLSGTYTPGTFQW